MNCPNCGAAVVAGSTSCRKCGGAVDHPVAPVAAPLTGVGPPAVQQPVQVVIQMPGAGPPMVQPTIGAPAKSRIAAGVLGILLGWLGIHRFYLGYTGIGIAQVLISCSCYGIVISSIWGLIEGIMILTGSFDRDAQGRPLRD